MSKYKIIVSDLHVGRGRILPDGSVNILEDFMADRQFSEFLEFYSSGQYYDADVELILNGDILNLIQVDYRGYYSPILTEAVSNEKLRSVIKGHPKFFGALKTFASIAKHRITYVVGNHDVDMIWDSCKQVFSEAVGVSVNFKNFTYLTDGIHVEHGHQQEEVNRLNPKKIFITKGLKEPIINLPWGSHFVINFILPSKIERPAIDKVRPISAFVKWSLMNDFRWAIKAAFRTVLYFFATRFSRSLYRTNNIVTTFKIFKEITIKPPSFVAAARKILEQNPDTHTVIMGHSHRARYLQFQDGREYLNSGTWTEVTSLDLMNLGKGTRYSYVLVDYSRNPTRPHAYLREWLGQWHQDLDQH